MALALGQSRAATYTVTTTNDAGAGSLRAAITSANGALGADTIRFNIAGAGVRTITLASALPTITDQVLIDGYTQPGSSVNTVGPGSNAVLRIELNGNNAVATGFTINTFHCYVRGLVINRFTTNSINIAAGADNARIQGNFIGTNAAGTAASGTGNGIVVFGANSQIGGWGGEDRNQISGCTSSPAIRLTGASCTGTQIRANNIGISSDGTTVIGGVQVGLRAENGSTLNAFGETGCCYNQIAGCTNQGVVVADAATRLDIKANYIWGNGGLGIDLANNGVTTNDLNDTDNGPNNLINFPVLVNAMSDLEGRVYVDFTYNGTPSTWIRFDFYANASPDATHGEGQLWIGTRYFETSPSGSDLFHATVGAWNWIPVGTKISCTATNEGLGATSEYAANIACTGQRFMVTNTNDVVNGDTSSVRNLMYNQGGDGVSLREAFLAANNNYDGWTANYIYFDLPGAGVQTITPTSPLPALTTATNVMGITDPEYSSTPVVHLIGTSTGSGADGIVFDWGWGGLYGFSITGFGGNAITVNAASIEVNYCHLGVSPDGVTCAGNSGAGVYVNNTYDTEIGNPWWPGSPNVISGNAAGGIIIDGADAAYTRVSNCRIGTNMAGTAAICSQPFGVSIRNGAHDNYIGSENATMENVISGHPQQGIIATGNGNEVSYSFIGTNLAGTAAIPNGLGGINMTGTDTWIHHNTISGNTGSGITLSGDAATVDANNIGTNKAGTAALPNTQYGVIVNAGNGAWIGDGLSPTRNIISGNTLDGIYLNSASTNDVAVRGNYIGLGANGTTMIANGRDGLRTNGANDVNLRLNVISGNVGHGVNVIGGDGTNLSGNLIGTDATGTLDRGNAMNGVTVNGSSNILVGTDIADPNIISGNDQHGVDLLGAATTFPQIFGNHIGLNAAGTAAIPNTFHGINIRSGIGSGRIGAPGSLMNVISGNTYSGIFMQGPNGQDIRSNYIGTNAAGTVAVPNVQEGIRVSNAMTGLLVGGVLAGEGNLISGNGMNGIHCSPVTGTITNGSIRGNTIGLNAAGNAALPNALNGILLGVSCNTFTIGGTTAAARNVVSGNGEVGMELLGTVITVHGNYVGTDATGATAIGNTYAGVEVKGTGCIMGGAAAGAGNVISGNGDTGIDVSATGCIIRGNRVGTNATGTAALANGANGISLGASTTVGGTGANEGNLISGNGTSGIYGSSTPNCIIQGNTIGLNAAGTAALGNGDAGIRLMNSNTCTIGGSTAAARNVVSGNGINGFSALYLGGGTGHTVQGNYIGTNAAGTAGIANVYAGIDLGSNATLIGGTTASMGNLIAYNGGEGIGVTSTGNRIFGNSIHTNASLGIDLGYNGVTANDAGDADNGANRLQNFPVLTTAISAAGNTTINGTFNSSASTTYRLEFFSSPTADASGYGEGQTYLGTANVTTDASGNATIGTTLTGVTVTAGHVVTATATSNTDNNTSEFSNAIVSSAGADISGIVFEDVNYGGGAGRDLATALGNGGTVRAGVRVELYSTTTSGSTYLGSTLTNAGGAYTFTGLAPQNYTVRVVNGTVSSSRPGSSTAHIGVQTFRKDASTGSAVDVTDHVGGEVPNMIDAGNGSTTLAALTTATTTAQSITGVTLGASSISGVDFGYNFNTVVNTNNTGQGSLREFLHHANAMSDAGLAIQGRTAGIDHGIFMISNGTASAGLRVANNYFVGGIATIMPTTFLPHAIAPVVIDAQTQPGWVSAPIVELNGNGGGATGLRFTPTAGSSILRGVIINRFNNEGLELEGDGITVQGCYVGTNAAGTAAQGNAASGILITGDNCTVGGTTAATRNVISGNAWDGIQVNGSNNTTITGNYIGTNATGSAAIANARQGIEFDAASANCSILGNVISGNTQNGVLTNPSSGTISGLAIASNIIGLNAAGTSAIGNGTDGIGLINASNVIIGTNGDGINDAAERNIISGNSDDGIEPNVGISNVRIAGNYIGTNITGMLDRGNGQIGIHPVGGGIRIGTNADGVSDVLERNIISGNENCGISMIGGGATNNVIAGNWIGLNSAGTGALGNTQGGVRCMLGANNNRIGTNADGVNDAAEGNVICANGWNGVEIFSGSTGTIVAGNYIGLRPDGVTAQGNVADGIHINASANNVIGGLAIGARNVIAGNGQDGIQITAAGSNTNQISGNNIGTNSSGNTAMPNAQNGVRLDFAANGTMIGGMPSAARNVISGNTGSGVYIDQTSVNSNLLNNYIGVGADGNTDVGNGGSGVFSTNGSTGTMIGNGTAAGGNVISGNAGDGIHFNTNAHNGLVRGNYIGTNATGTAAVPNLTGITLFNSNSHTVGGNSPAMGNVISGNTNLGVQLAWSVNNVVIQGNLVGVAANGTSALGNGLDGFRISDGANTNNIGGLNAGEGNIIANNGFMGIRMESSAGLANRILRNSIRDNGSLGIDLHNDGPTPNDANDADAGGNELQNYPVLTSAAVSGSNISINGNLNSAPNTQYRVEFFSSPTADPSGYGEGATFIGAAPYTTDASGTVAINSTFIGAPPVGQKITSTATKITTGVPRSTSEFSGLITSTLPPVAVCQDPTLYLNASGTATLTPAMADGGSYDPDGTIVSMTLTQTAFTCADIGEVGVLLIVTDNNGATAACSTFVDVVDTIAPTILGCPGDLYYDIASGCLATYFWPVPTVSDNCSGATIVRTTGPTNAGILGVGVHAVVYTATDASGNTSTCSFTVTVEDNIPPYFSTCQANITTNAAPGACTADITAFLSYGIVDNCSSVLTQTAGPDVWLPVPVGVHNVTFLLTDPSGNTATCSFVITVNDATDPVIVGCPGNITVNASPCVGVATWTVPTATDNCSGVTIVRTTSRAPGSGFPIGTTPVTYVATDASGNTDTCTFTVTVLDVTAPTITCPPNATYPADPGMCSRASMDIGLYSSTSTCSTGNLVTYDAVFPLAVGTHTITWTATDNNGNASSCQQIVTITDEEDPVISGCPSNITVNTGPDCSASATWTVPTFTDNCAGGTIVRTGPAPGSLFPVGTTPVTYTATDASGNTAICSFTVTVVDATAPSITCPANMVVNVDAGLCGATVNYTAPVGNDNCAGSTTTRTAGLASGSFFPVGPNTVTYQVTDAHGNTTSCSFTITVNDNEAPTLACPANITTTTDAGQCGAIVTYAAPVATDNCGNATITRTAGLASGSLFPSGTTWVIYEITQGGQTNTCAFSVTVNDMLAPVIAGCPSNISVNTGAMGCSANATWTVPTFTDNCTGGTITRTAGPAPGSLFPVGTTPVTYTATDAAGNTSTCSFTVTVVDVTAPNFIVCQSNLTVNVDPGTCTADVSMIVTFTYNDNCGVTNISQTAGSDYEQPLTAGVHPMTFTLTDPAGNSATCSFTVTVVDNIAPSITCPANIVVNNTPGICGAVVNYTAPVGTDNCSGATRVMTAGLASGSQFPVGTTTVTYEVTDAAGLTASCSFTVTVNDTEAPVAVCQPVTIGLNGSGVANLVPAQVDGGSTDNCAITSMTVVPNSFNSVGTFPVTLTVFDAAGNSDDCTVNVTVQDNNAPTAVCQPVTIYVDAAGNASIVAADIDGGSTDNGTIVSLVASQTAFDCSDLGANNVTLTVTDDGGNTDNCIAVVTVLDIIPPTAICQNITVQLNAMGAASITAAAINNGSSDNCAITSMTVDQTAFTCADLGANTVVLTVTDASGNTSTCNATVTIQDNIAPAITCPANISVNNDAGFCGAVVNYTAPVGTDNCGGSTTIRTAGLASGSTFPVGVNTVTYQVTDAAGNSLSCSFTVTVTDVTAPVIVGCPSNINVNAGASCTATASWTVPTFTDNCAGGTIALTSGLAPGSSFPIGTNTVTYTATDVNGNPATCSFTVTVIDVTAPVIVGCPSNISVNAGAGCTATATWAVPTYTDNCAGGSIALTAGLASGSAFPIGTNTVSYTATDAAGNPTTCSFTVTVVDVTAPAIACPANITVSNDAGICGAVVNYTTPVGTDNCSGVTTVMTAGLASGSQFPVGTTTVTYEVTDAAGLIASCSFTVTVNDTEAPVAICQAVSVNLDGSGTATITAADVNNGSTDNCAIVSMTLSQYTFAAVGPYSVTLTVTDAAGNSDDCTVTVTVTDNNPPDAVCQPVTIYLDAAGNATIVAADIDGGSTDNGTIVSLIASQTSFDCSDLGTNNVTLTVTDDGGNSDDCIAIVTVIDTIAPTAVCQNISAYLDASGNVTITGADLNGGSPDNCATATLTYSASTASFDCSNLGPQIVTLTVTDASGNSSSCSATVTVQDTIAPTLACADATINVDLNGWAVISASAIATWSDNCSSGLTSWTSTDSVNVVGDTTIWVFVQDITGNVDSCSATVTISDSNPPVAVCQDVTIYLDAAGNATIVAADIDGGSTDNGTIVSLIASQTSFDCSDLGANNVTLTVTDDGGNSDDCVAIVTVLDTIAPTAVCQNISAFLDASGNVTITGADLNGGSSDNCGTATLTYSASTASFDCSNLGPQTVTLTVTDASGNSSTCSATVTVQDTIAPTLACANATINVDMNGWAVISASAIATWSDNCSSGLTSWTSTDSVNVVGDTTIWVFVQDITGNVDSCSATVTISDSNPPVAVCQPVTIYLDAAGNATIVAADIDGGSTDNGTIVSLIASQTAFDCSDLGANNVNLTVTDDGGNSDDCVAVVTVIDTIAPTLNCQPFTLVLDSNGQALINANELVSSSNDNCTGLVLTTDVNTIEHAGTYSVTVTASDASGNSVSCTSSVTVIDTILPEANCLAFGGLLVYLDSVGVTTIAPMQLDGGSYDNDTIVSYAASQTMFDCGNVGSNSVTLTVTDASGNTMSCTSIVMVLDTIAPTVICQNITLALDSTGTANITGIELDGGTTDNCADLGFSSDISTFNTVGDYTVILTVTDASGNSSMCSASVTVIDSIPPTILCQPATIYLDASGNASITAADIDGGSSDNVDITSLTESQTAFDCSDLGANAITLIALDAYGNSDSCIAVVTVLDTIAPNVVCQNITISLGENGTAIITGAQLNGGSSDNCGALTFTTSTNTFSSVGSYTVVLTVTDAGGNSSTCTATVDVNDTDEPNALCQPTTIYLDANGSASIVAADIDGGSTDNGTIISIVASETDFGCDQLGENSVTLTATDDQGNVSTCIAIVTVLDTIAPSVSCQDITLAVDDNGVAIIEAVQLSSGSVDNCDSLSYSIDTESWSTAGSYEVTLTVTDASGNSSSCTAMVTVTSDRDDPLVIPSGFSPNGDGVGDNWVIQGLGENAVVNVEIFNRWGQLVHSSGDYRNDWDGTCTRGLGSDRLPDGTYFYVVEIADGEARTMNGYLQIAR